MASRAVELAEAGRFAESLVMFDALVQVMPHDATAHEQRAQLLLELDLASEAVASAEHATTIQPEWAIGWLTLGRARLNAGAFGESAVALQRALALDSALLDEVADDLTRAQALHRRRDEAELPLHTGTTLRLQQWRDTGDAGSHQFRESSEQSQCLACPSRNSDQPRQGTGTMVWECGIVLAKLLDHMAAGGVMSSSPLHAVYPARPSLSIGQQSAGQLLSGINVVELGAGTGIGGLAAAALGARVVLTDVASVVPLIAANVAANRDAIAHAGGEVVVTTLDWDAESNTSADLGSDLVLAADALYHRDDSGRQLEAFARTVGRLTKACGGRLLLVHKARHAILDEALAGSLKTHASMELREVPLEHHHPDFRSPSIHVYIGERTVADSVAFH